MRLARAADDLYRVIDRGGRIAGHIRVLARDAGIRYRAQRYSPRRQSFAELGEFWSLEDAVACALGR